MARSRWSPSLFALVALLGACGCTDPGNDEPLAEATVSIEGGYSDDATTAVVAIFSGGVGSLCSGSLIAPNVVLTAGHCVAPTLGEVNGGVLCSETTLGEPYVASAFFVSRATEVTLANAGEYLVEEVSIPTASGGSICGRDVAILVLASAVPADVATPFEPRVFDPIAEGENYSAVGYGQTAAGGDSGTRRRRDDLEVDCVGDGCSASLPLELNEWLGETGPCSGDSGGPALDASSRVMGVISRGAESCALPIYGDVYRWRSWIMDTTAYAAGLGEHPLPAWASEASVDPVHSAPIGAPCAGPEDCYTNLCMQHDGYAYCSRPCDDDNACPEPATCMPEGCRQPLVPIAAPAPVEEEEGCAIGSLAAPHRRAGGLALSVAAFAAASAARRSARRRRPLGVSRDA